MPYYVYIYIVYGSIYYVYSITETNVYSIIDILTVRDGFQIIFFKTYVAKKTCIFISISHKIINKPIIGRIF